MKLTHEEINFLLDHAKSNREASAALAKHPGQKWAEAHRSEVKMMDRLIEKLEDMKKPATSKPCSRHHEIVLSDGSGNGKVLHSTSSMANLMTYTQEVTDRINRGELRIEDVWLREVRDTPISAVLDAAI